MKFLQPEQYQPKLTKLYEQLSEALKEVLPYVRVEHIGSSAIKGAASKGDLDVFVGVEKAKFNDALAEIQSLGFKIKEGTLRTESLCMLETSIFGMSAAIQLVENGTEFEDFIRFRDILNSKPELVEQYNELKRRSTGLGMEDYRAVKSQFIEKILSSN